MKVSKWKFISFMVKRFWTPIEPETFECIAESGRGDEDHLQGRP